MSLTTIHCPCWANVNEITMDRVTEIRSLPFLDITSPVSNIPYLSNVDIDKHMPSDTNFGYYTPHDFHSSNDIIECLSNDKAFSALHCNIRSLSANLDNLIHMLSELNHSFPLIGLSETKISYDKDLHVNVDLTGYDFISEPSHTNAGGVAFYIKNNFNYVIRSEFTKSTHDFEALWIEIDFHNQPKLLCGIVYRHPSSNLDNFMNYINSTVDHIHHENKFCLSGVSLIEEIGGYSILNRRVPLRFLWLALFNT